MIVEEDHQLELEPNGGWDDRIHSVKCGEMVRAYIVVCQRFVLIYDTLLGPRSGDRLRELALERAGDRGLFVVNSHADWDHYFGNMSFRGHPILASRLCADRIRGEVGAAELAQKRAERADCYDTVELVAPTIAVDGAATLDGGDLTMRLLPTPGHRPDHLALWIPELGILLPGDCVEDPIPLVDEDSAPEANTLGELITSLETMLALEPNWVLANHAAPEPGDTRLRANLTYLRKLQRTAAEASSLETVGEALPVDPAWGDFYRSAHQNQLRMAWEQRARS